jgi:hypothetical protein
MGTKKRDDITSIWGLGRAGWRWRGGAASVARGEGRVMA